MTAQTKIEISGTSSRLNSKLRSAIDQVSSVYDKEVYYG